MPRVSTDYDLSRFSALRLPRPCRPCARYVGIRYWPASVSFHTSLHFTSSRTTLQKATPPVRPSGPSTNTLRYHFAMQLSWQVSSCNLPLPRFLLYPSDFTFLTLHFSMSISYSLLVLPFLISCYSLLSLLFPYSLIADIGEEEARMKTKPSVQPSRIRQRGPKSMAALTRLHDVEQTRGGRGKVMKKVRRLLQSFQSRSPKRLQTLAQARLTDCRSRPIPPARPPAALRATASRLPPPPDSALSQAIA